MTGVAADSEAHGLLRELDALLDKLAATDLTALPGERLLDFTRGFERVTRRSVTVQHAAVAELDSRRAAGETGHTSTAALLADLLRINPGQARRRIRDAGEFAARRGLSGEPLPPVLPQTARALDAGQIGIEHARAVSDLFSHIPGYDADAEAEQAIESAALDVAALCPPHQLKQWCVQAAARLNQDGAEPKDETQQRQRGLNLIDQPDGTAKVTGRLTPFAAAALRAVLGPLSAPAPAEDGARDERTASQRRHDGLAATSTGADSADAQTAAAGDTATAADAEAATGTADTAVDAGSASGYGVTSYGTLIPVDELLRRASDAKIIPVVLNDAGGVMSYGRNRRLASPAQRRALAARDGGCVRPGCTVPADWCETNHVIPWQHGGLTDLANMALVCSHDHDELDRGATIVMTSGVPHWVEPAYLDPSQTPRRNTAHHIPRVLDTAVAAQDSQHVPR